MVERLYEVHSRDKQARTIIFLPLPENVKAGESGFAVGPRTTLELRRVRVYPLLAPSEFSVVTTAWPDKIQHSQCALSEQK
jgi:hypothetical protein